MAMKGEQRTEFWKQAIRLVDECAPICAKMAIGWIAACMRQEPYWRIY
jgi:hypothetical protein